MGFSGSVNGTTRNPGFLDFGFCQCKWAYSSLVWVIKLVKHVLQLSLELLRFQTLNRTLCRPLIANAV